MGVWTKGDYSILVALDSISLHLNRCQHSIQRSLGYYSDKDSSLPNYFLATSNRYKAAANQLDKVKMDSELWKSPTDFIFLKFIRLEVKLWCRNIKKTPYLFC